MQACESKDVGRAGKVNGFVICASASHLSYPNLQEHLQVLEQYKGSAQISKLSSPPTRNGSLHVRCLRTAADVAHIRHRGLTALGLARGLLLLLLLLLQEGLSQIGATLFRLLHICGGGLELDAQAVKREPEAGILRTTPCST